MVARWRWVLSRRAGRVLGSGRHVVRAWCERVWQAGVARAGVGVVSASDDTGPGEPAPGGVASAAAEAGGGAECSVLRRVLDVITSGDAPAALVAGNAAEGPARTAGTLVADVAD